MPAEAVAPIDAGALAELIDVVGRPYAVLDPDMRAAHEMDWTGRFRGATPGQLPGLAAGLPVFGWTWCSASHALKSPLGVLWISLWPSANP